MRRARVRGGVGARARSARDGPDGDRAHAAEARQHRRAPRASTRRPCCAARTSLAEAERRRPTLVIIATGSEVEVAVGAKKLLDADGQARARRVGAVLEAFERQDAAYRDAVLPPGVRRVVDRDRRDRAVARRRRADGLVIGRDDFGASAPDKDIQKEFGFTPEAVADKIKKWLG